MEPIVKDKPLPTLSRRGAQPKYPWKEMQPGDAFRFPMHITRSSASAMAHTAGYQWQMKFAVRADGDGTIWCWRIDGTAYETMNGNVRQEVEIAARGYVPESMEGVTVTNPNFLNLPPIQKTASQLRTEQIIADRKAALAAIGERDDI